MERLNLVLGLAIVIGGGLAACGEPFVFTTSGSGGSSSSAGTVGATGTGGQGGATGSTSTVSVSASSAGSSGGATCTPNTLGSCAPDHYCRKDTQKCDPCSTLGRFEFGPSAKIAVAMPAVGFAAWPRVDDAYRLYFSLSQAGSGSHLAAATVATFPAWNGAALMPSPPNQTLSTGTDIGGLPLGDGGLVQPLLGGDPTVLTGAKVLLFDSDRDQSGGPRKLFVWPTGSSGQPIPLQMPGAVVGSTQYRVAAATDVKRLWWITDANDTNPLVPARLVTAKVGDGGFVEVPVKLDDDCAAYINQPWAIRNGHILLFSAVYTCTPSDTVQHLFFVHLDPSSGQPSDSKATRVYPMDAVDSGTPSLTPNYCGILFARAGVLFAAGRN